MGHQDDLKRTNSVSKKVEVAKTNHSEPNPKSELSDEQMAKVAGGFIGGFPDMGSSQDPSINPDPTVPGSTPSMP